MGRAVVRRHAVVLTLGLTAPLLAGCSSGPSFSSDKDDLVAATSVWSDAWVAPTAATVAGPALGSNGQVDRVVGRRTTTYAADVEAVVRAELDLAAKSAWAPTSSTCGDSVQVALAGPGDALAQLVVTPDGEASKAAIQAVTRFHLDSDWPVPDTIDGTCLDGESPGFEAPPLQSAPMGDRDPGEVAEWADDRTDDRVVAAAAADPGLEALGIRVADTRLEGGMNRRRAPAAEVQVAADTLADLAGELGPGWQLTYAACGADGPSRGTFMSVLDGLPAVAAVSLSDGEADVRVTLTTAQGPDGYWLSETAVLDPGIACLPRDASGPLLTYGSPAVLPGSLTPIAGYP
jgi:hypothetical protein